MVCAFARQLVSSLILLVVLPPPLPCAPPPFVPPCLLLTRLLVLDEVFNAQHTTRVVDMFCT